MTSLSRLFEKLSFQSYNKRTKLGFLDFAHNIRVRKSAALKFGVGLRGFFSLCLHLILPTLILPTQGHKSNFAYIFVSLYLHDEIFQYA